MQKTLLSNRHEEKRLDVNAVEKEKDFATAGEMERIWTGH